jgi:hypothetical protein
MKTTCTRSSKIFLNLKCGYLLCSQQYTLSPLLFNSTTKKGGGAVSQYFAFKYNYVNLPMSNFV